MQSSLRATAAFDTVDTFDARAAEGGGVGTPNSSHLAGYHAVLAFSGWPFADAALLGERLAAFHDQGGGVVVAVFANTQAPFTWGNGATPVGGTYSASGGGYALLDYASGNATSPSDSLGDVLEPQSPLMSGVTSLAATSAWRSTAGVAAGREATVVARWGGGAPLVLRGARGDRTLVELNFYPPSGSAYPGGWTGDGAALLRNGLKYSRCMPCGKGTYAAAGGDGGFT